MENWVDRVGYNGEVLVYIIYIYIYKYIYIYIIYLYILYSPVRPLLCVSFFFFFPFYFQAKRGVYMYTGISSPFMAGSASAQANGSPLVGSMQFSGGLLDFLRNLPGYFQGSSAHSVANEVVPGSAKKDDSNFFEDIWNDLESLIDGATDDISSFLIDFLKDSGLYYSENSASTVNKDASISGLDSSTVNYLNAELAKFYGMDRATAYQEALSNTAYQRAVRDMKNAGLNPAALFGGGRGTSASGVSYIGRSAGSGSGSGKEENLFSDGVYHGLPILAGLAAAIATRNPKNFLIVQQTATALMGLADDYSKLK